ncbi:MAG: hypothetical protein DMG91_07570, partial [Acidobacteria bacterium]
QVSRLDNVRIAFQFLACEVEDFAAGLQGFRLPALAQVIANTHRLIRVSIPKREWAGDRVGSCNPA